MSKMENQGERSRKYSICLGISSIVSLIYVIYQIAHIVISYQQASMQTVGTQIGTGIGITLSLPHLLFVILATIFVIVAFFTNGFGFAISAGVLFSVAGVLLFVWFPFVIPSIVFTFIGSSFCYKKKIEKQEAEEEKRYRQEHPAPAVQHQRPNFVNHEAAGSGYERASMGMQTAAYQQPRNANPYGMNAYAQNPMLQGQMVSDPYAPIPPMVQANPMMSPQPVYAANPQMQANPVAYPYAAMQEPMGEAVAPYTMPIAPQQNTCDRISNGYFDDFGNFHPGQGGNF